MTPLMIKILMFVMAISVFKDLSNLAKAEELEKTFIAMRVLVGLILFLIYVSRMAYMG